MANMSDDFDFDNDFLEQIDRIESQALRSQKRPPDESFDQFESFAFDDAGLLELDRLEAVATAQVTNVATTSTTTKSRPLSRQTTLLGGIVPSKPPANTFRRTISQPRSQPPKPKTPKLWPRDAFRKHGWNIRKKKGKLAAVDDDDDDGEENIEFEQFPHAELQEMCCVQYRTPTAMKLQVDKVAAKNWLFPTNREKRDYQFNIIKNSLFENCLVALPTGLGKTFIAAVVMYNYYRWFPEGKLIFVAPTKPLVNQQIEACHNVCGIPQEDCAVMMGGVSAEKRVSHWMHKRVYFMTPQTLTIELAKKAVDPTDIILLVIDEAHRGTGNYAYAQIVRYLMHTNPFVRFLALTATPANSVEKAQVIVDSLHISHIEMRNEGSLDIRQYIHKKEIRKYIVEPSKELAEVRDALVDLMKIVHVPLREYLPIGASGYTGLSAYRCQMLMQDSRLRQRGGLYPPVRKLGALARAMGSLLEGSFIMCWNTLREEAESEIKKHNSKKNSSSSKGCDIDGYRKVLAILEPLCGDASVMHPKQSQVKAIALEHFTRASQDGESTRMIVFATFRDYVEEIVRHLNEEDPIIRAVAFVGQGGSKSGARGMKQKEQLEVLGKFKKGEFNILVATSVGEEGLDIGEVDAIVCYDCSKDSIRTLQRAGRTGRKKAGCVHVLMAEGREETNWQKALDNYHGVQEQVLSGKNLELYTDVHRLIPKDISPQPLELNFTIEEYVPEKIPTSRMSRSGSTTGAKRKRDSNPGRNIPEGGSVGFIKAIALKPKGKGSRKQPIKQDFSKSLSDSDDDKRIMAGPQFKRRKTHEVDEILHRAPAPSRQMHTSPILDIAESSDSSEFAYTSTRLAGTSEGVGAKSKMLMSSPDPLLQNSGKIGSRRSPVPLRPNHTSNLPSPMFHPRGKCIQPLIPAESIRSPPGPTQPVRVGGRRVARQLSSSPRSPHSPLRRLRRLEPHGPGPLMSADEFHGGDNAEENDADTHPSLIDDEAVQSGNDTSESNEEVEVEETEEDRCFLMPLPETQVPPNYAQTQVYRQSLFTQPAMLDAPITFRDRPSHRSYYVKRESSKRRPGVSSSPPHDHEMDEYEYDDFVIPDLDC